MVSHPMAFGTRFFWGIVELGLSPPPAQKSGVTHLVGSTSPSLTTGFLHPMSMTTSRQDPTPPQKATPGQWVSYLPATESKWTLGGTTGRGLLNSCGV